VKPLLKEIYKYVLPFRIIICRLFMDELYPLYTATATISNNMMVAVVMTVMIMIAAAAAAAAAVVVVRVW
jgi:hypothetical protein